MMYCRYCGTQNPDNSKFCHTCGKKLKKEQIAEGSQLPRILRNNAYHILGLDASSDPKAIQKRGREIIARLTIDDLPGYDLDIEKPGLFRNIQSVKDAVQKLSSPKTSLFEFFFWFNFGGTPNTDEIIASIRENDSTTCLKLMSAAADHGGNKKELAGKNRTIYWCILFSSRKSKAYLNPSLDSWKSLVQSDTFWADYIDTYKTLFAFDITPEVITEFRAGIVAALSDMYTEISQLTDDPDYLLEFQRRFATRGGRVEKEVLDPVFQKIQSSVEVLNSLDISKNRSSDPGIIREIDSHLTAIRGNFNKLVPMGLYEDSITKSMRDKAAEAIRNTSLRINNEWSNPAKALEVLQSARSIAGSPGLRIKLENETRQLEEIRLGNLVLPSIEDLIRRKQYDEALALIEKQMPATTSAHVREVFISRKKACIAGIALMKYNVAVTEYNQRNFTGAGELYDQISTLLYDNLALFNFPKQDIDHLLSTIPDFVSGAVTQRSLHGLDIFRKNNYNTIRHTIQGKDEHYLVIILFDSRLFLALIKSGIPGGNSPEPSGDSFKFPKTVITRDSPLRHAGRGGGSAACCISVMFPIAAMILVLLLRIDKTGWGTVVNILGIIVGIIVFIGLMMGYWVDFQ